MNDNCPSEFALDDFELHGGLPAVAIHLQGCPRCQARRDARAAAMAMFDGELARATWGRIRTARAAARPRRGRAASLSAFLVAAVAGAAGLIVFTGRTQHHAVAPYVATKGQALAEVLCRRGDRTFVIAPHDTVAPGDLLRFRPRPVRPDARFIQIGSVDGTGHYASFYPPAESGPSVALPPAGEPLEGSVRLDDAPGPERLLVVLSPRALPPPLVRSAAEERAATLAPLTQIGGVPVTASWIVLEKAPPSPEPRP